MRASLQYRGLPSPPIGEEPVEIETHDDEEDEIDSSNIELGPSAQTRVLAPDEQRLLAGIERQAFPGLNLRTGGPEPAAVVARDAARIGRYAILRKLGEGGMGVVYACYDEQLDRKVAVKLLRSRYQDARARTRLEREAQGLARLSHPNVVQIYEIGVHEDAVFLAMEFIAGQTLRTWLTEQEASLERRLEILVQAGRGLAAAHAADLVHRDFKPDNVIVGDDGRVRVLDFGLVREVCSVEREPELLDATVVEDPEAIDTQESGTSLSTNKLLSRPLTRVGSVLGTPAYMAPEQLAGLPCDAHADQFAFCVVAFEVLHGRRPFDASTLTELREAIRAQTIVKQPSERGIPRALRDALARGLAPERAARWPRLDDLLDVFDAHVHRSGQRRWRLGLGLGLAAGAMALGLGLTQANPNSQLCAIDEAALAGTWDDERRAELRASFDATALALAGPSSRLAEEVLDAWRSDWVEAQRSACEATRVTALASEALLERRQGCLERKRRELVPIIELLSQADAEIVGHSPELLSRLPRVEDCADSQLVDSRFPIPAGRAATLEPLHEDLARSRALASIGRIHEAEAIVDELTGLLDELDHPPLELEIRALVGERQLWRHELDAAISSLRAVAREAEALHLDDLGARVRVRLAREAVRVWGHPERETWLIEDAEAALARLERGPGPLDVELQLARGWAEEGAGELVAALAAFRAAAALAEELGEPSSVASAKLQVARTLAELGRADEAAQIFDTVAASAEASHGPQSPLLAEVEVDRALLAIALGDLDHARAHLDHARSIHVDVFGPATPRLARAELVAGKLALTTAQFAQAAEIFARVLALDPERVRPELRADALEGRGVAAFYLDDLDASLDAYRRALVLRRQLSGENHPRIGLLHSNIGESLAARGDLDGALVAYARAIGLLERALGPDHADLALPYKARGQARLALAMTHAAVEDLERALAIHAANPGEPLERADVEFSLARALDAQGEGPRPLALAEAARARYIELELDEPAAAITAWLAAR